MSRQYSIYLINIDYQYPKKPALIYGSSSSLAISRFTMTVTGSPWVFFIPFIDLSKSEQTTCKYRVYTYAH